jgi:hypothetical protein
MEKLKFDYTFAKHLYNKFKDIEFEDKQHVYINHKFNKELVSVTQSLKLFEPEFDVDYWSNKKAKERGITQEDILKEWEEKKIKGLDRGNVYHDYIELRHNKSKPGIILSDIESYFKTHDDIPLLSEFVIGNENIGGKLDHLAIRGNHLIIKDWKTNAKFVKESPYKLINGLDHLPNTEFYKYALQLSLYKYILDIDDIKELEVVWFNNNTHTVFKIPYLYEEVQHINNYVNSRTRKA